MDEVKETAEKSSDLSSSIKRYTRGIEAQISSLVRDVEVNIPTSDQALQNAAEQIVKVTNLNPQNILKEKLE